MRLFASSKLLGVGAHLCRSVRTRKGYEALVVVPSYLLLDNLPTTPTLAELPTAR